MAMEQSSDANLTASSMMAGANRQVEDNGGLRWLCAG